MAGSLIIMEGSSLLRFFYSNGWQPYHYGRQFVVVIYVTLMDGSVVIKNGSLLFKFYLLQWMVDLSLWKVVCCRYFCYNNGWQPCHYGRQSIVEIFVTTMDGSLVIMEGSSLLIFFYSSDKYSLVIMESSLLLRFFYSNGWQPCHYGRQFVVEILLLQWMVALSLWKVACCLDFCYSIG